VNLYNPKILPGYDDKVNIGNWHLHEYMCMLRSCVLADGHTLILDPLLFRELRLGFRKNEFYETKGDIEKARQKSKKRDWKDGTEVAKEFAARII